MATPLIITTVPLPTSEKIDAYDAAVRQAFAQSGRGRVVRGPEGRTLEPRPIACRRGRRTKAMSRDNCPLNIFQLTRPEPCWAIPVSTTTVALVGDSHAGMWSQAFQQVATQRHWRLESLAKAACPSMDLPPTPAFTASTPSASSGAVRSSPDYGPNTRGWSCWASRAATASKQVSRHTTRRRPTAWTDSLRRYAARLRRC